MPPNGKIFPNPLHLVPPPKYQQIVAASGGGLRPKGGKPKAIACPGSETQRSIWARTGRAPSVACGTEWDVLKHLEKMLLAQCRGMSRNVGLKRIPSPPGRRTFARGFGGRRHSNRFRIVPGSMVFHVICFHEGVGMPRQTNPAATSTARPSAGRRRRFLCRLTTIRFCKTGTNGRTHEPQARAHTPRRLPGVSDRLDDRASGPGPARVGPEGARRAAPGIPLRQGPAHLRLRLSHLPRRDGRALRPALVVGASGTRPARRIDRILSDLHRPHRADRGPGARLDRHHDRGARLSWRGDRFGGRAGR